MHEAFDSGCQADLAILCPPMCARPTFLSRRGARRLPPPAGPARGRQGAPHDAPARGVGQAVEFRWWTCPHYQTTYSSVCDPSRQGDAHYAAAVESLRRRRAPSPDSDEGRPGMSFSRPRCIFLRPLPTDPRASLGSIRAPLGRRRTAPPRRG